MMYVLSFFHRIRYFVTNKEECSLTKVGSFHIPGWSSVSYNYLLHVHVYKVTIITIMRSFDNRSKIHVLLTYINFSDNNTMTFNSIISRISLKYGDDDISIAQNGMQIFAQTARL